MYYFIMLIVAFLKKICYIKKIRIFLTISNNKGDNFMNFILTTIFLFLVIGAILEWKIDCSLIKQIAKYNEGHSDVSATSTEDFISKINSIPNLGVSNIICNGNLVNLVYQKNEYVINIENGVASIKYDMSGCGFSRKYRIFKMFKIIKALKKAISINFIMDCVSGKDTSEHTKEYKKIKNNIKAFYISLIAMIICCIIGVIVTLGDSHDNIVAKVKTTEFVNGVTYEEIIDRYLETSEWIAFLSNTDTAIVEISGISVEDEAICIQFSGFPGMGFTDMNDFTLSYFEVNNESLEPIAAMEYMYEYLYS